MQAASIAVWDDRYRLKGEGGTPLDRDVDDTLVRVARALGGVEATAPLRAFWTERFLWALRRGAIPAGRILANAGRHATTPAATLINCTVADQLRDTPSGWTHCLDEARLTLAAGAGTGYDFSPIRPQALSVASTGGPLALMRQLDAAAAGLMQGGHRRGAQMACLDISHPDVLAFIRAKAQPGELSSFNLSLLIPQDFIAAVRADTAWPLCYPASLIPDREAMTDSGLLSDPARCVWRPWPGVPLELTDAAGRAPCLVDRWLPARVLLDAIADAAFESGEPGFVRVDLHNEFNNNWFCEEIRATNPCGEQGLPPLGACLLGSMDLSRFVSRPFTDTTSFDWQGFIETAEVFTRLLDNVVELHRLPLAAQATALIRTRRHGMGFLGIGTALAMLGQAYGSPASVAFTGAVAQAIALAGWRTGRDLAREKGMAPLLAETFVLNARHLAQKPALKAQGYRVGDRVPGHVLHARFSRFLQEVARVDPELVAALAESGARFTHHGAIAPTGTIALAMADNASSGIEPSYAHEATRRMRLRHAAEAQSFALCSREALAFREHLRLEGMTEAQVLEHPLPPHFKTAHEIPGMDQLAVQAAAQQWVDGAISKTVNVPAGMSQAAFRKLFEEALCSGVKGCTFFRQTAGGTPGVLSAAPSSRCALA